MLGNFVRYGVAVSLLSSAAYTLPILQIEYKDDLVLDGPQIFFSDIADVSCGGECDEGNLEVKEQITKLKKEYVGQVAQFGLTRYLSTQVLNQKLLVPLADKYVVEGAEERRIKIQTAYTELPEDSVSLRISAFLQDTKSRLDGDIQFDIIDIPKIIKAPKVPYHYTIEALPAFERRGSQTIYLMLETEKGFKRKIPISIYIRVYDTVYVSSDKIKRNSELSSAAIQKEYRDITKIRGIALRKQNELEGVITKQSILANQVITDKLLDLPSLIKQGDLVNVVTNHSGIVLSIPGIARQDGKLGQTIRINNTETHKLVKGKVLDKKTVELISTGS